MASSTAFMKTAAAALTLLVLLAGPMAALDIGGKTGDGGTAVDSTVQASTVDLVAAAQQLGCGVVPQCTDCQEGCSECEGLPAPCGTLCLAKCLL